MYISRIAVRVPFTPLSPLAATSVHQVLLTVGSVGGLLVPFTDVCPSIATHVDPLYVILSPATYAVEVDHAPRNTLRVASNAPVYPRPVRLALGVPSFVQSMGIPACTTILPAASRTVSSRVSSLSAVILPVTSRLPSITVPGGVQELVFALYVIVYT